LYGPVPPGLPAFNAPFCVPDALQKIKTGSLTVGADGYEVYRTALIPGAESWASAIAGINKTIIDKK
jgi:hypothetical protein